MHDRKLTACDDDSGLTTAPAPLEETALLSQSSPPHEIARHDLVARLSLAAGSRGAPSIPHDRRSADDQPSPSVPPEAVARPGDGEPDSTLLPAVAAHAFPFATWTKGSVRSLEKESDLPVPADDEFIEGEARAARHDPADHAETKPQSARAGPAEDPEERPACEASDAGQTPQEQPAAQRISPEDGSAEQGAESRRDQTAPAELPVEELPEDVEPSPNAVFSTAQGPDAGQPPGLEIPEARPAPQLKRRNAWRLLGTAARFAALALAVWFAAMVFLIVVFRFVDPPTSALMLLRSAQGVSIDQRWTPLEKISPNLVHAVITSEDGRFCSHWGIDPREIVEAIGQSSRGRPRGASTMTMQLAKNLFLWPHYSYVRKALEVPLTLTIDAVWPKRRIAEVYLNIVEWGPGIFGAGAAARRHFNRSAEKLTRQQAALLAVTLPNPRHRKPGSPSRLMNKMASTIVARMRASPSVDDCVISPR